MSRNSRPPSIPPLKLSVSDAIVRGRSPNGRRAPDADDLPDPQAGGEFSGRDSTPRDTATTGRTEAQEKPKSAATQQAAAEVEQETGTDAALRSTSRVRELISKFDKNPRTATKPSKLPTRNANTPEINETPPTSGKGKRCDSPKKTTPRDDMSDVDTSLPDVSEYTDGSMAGMLSIEEEANQNSTMHARWLQQTADFKTYVEPRQSSSAKINHRRNSSAGSKPKRTFMENQPKERTLTRAHRSTGGTPLSVLFNAPSPVRRVAAVETGQASSQSPLSVTKLETRTHKDQTGREATACAQRVSHVEKSPRHTPPPTNHGPKIHVKWDGPPANGGSSSTAGAPGESSLDSIRSRHHKKLMADIANPPCDSATEFNYSANQGPIASFAVHEPLLQPPCRAADRPVFEPNDEGAPAGEDSPRPSSDHNHPSNEHTTTTTTDKLKQGVAYFLSLLWTIPEKVMLIVVLMDWIMRLLRCTRGVMRNPFRLSQPIPPRRSAHEQHIDEARQEMMMRRGVLLIVLLSCCAFLATDFCSL